MSIPYLRLVRTADDGARATGTLDAYDHEGERSPRARFFVLERPWLANRRRVSCIPPGRYRIERRRSAKYGLHLHVRGTEPARSLILIHAGNDETDTEGCILIGQGAADLDSDGDAEITQSRAAVAALLALVPESGATDAILDVVDAARPAAPGAQAADEAPR